MIGVTNKEGNTEKRDTGVSLSVGAAKCRLARLRLAGVLRSLVVQHRLKALHDEEQVRHAQRDFVSGSQHGKAHVVLLRSIIRIRSEFAPDHGAQGSFPWYVSLVERIHDSIKIASRKLLIRKNFQ
jgi:hypothetical protein